MTLVMNAGCSTHVKNGPTCKDKWNMITSDFKKIFDLVVGIGQNQENQAMIIQENNNKQLPHNFE